VVGVVEWHRVPEDPGREPLRDAEPLAPLEVTPPAISSLAAYEAIVERPLFNPERRPPPAEQAVDDTAATPAGSVTDATGWRLTAVLREAERHTVLIEDQTGRTLALKAGDSLGDWKIEEIADDRVIIVTGSQRNTLLLHQFEPEVSKPRARKTPSYRRITRRPPAQPPAVRRAPDDDEGS
jgi:hypothetical protein